MYHCPHCFTLSESATHHQPVCPFTAEALVQEDFHTAQQVTRQLRVAHALRKAQAKTPPRVGTWTLLATLVISVLIPSLFQ